MHNFIEVCALRKVVVIESLWPPLSRTSGLLPKLTYITQEAETFYSKQNIDLTFGNVNGSFRDTLVLQSN